MSNDIRPNVSKTSFVSSAKYYSTVMCRTSRITLFVVISQMMCPGYYIFSWTAQPPVLDIFSLHGPLARCINLWVAHASGMPGTFSSPPRVSDPDRHHGTCVTPVPWCMPESLTGGLLRSRWRGKRSRHSRRLLLWESFKLELGTLTLRLYILFIHLTNKALYQVWYDHIGNSNICMRLNASHGASSLDILSFWWFPW